MEAVLTLPFDWWGKGHFSRGAQAVAQSSSVRCSLPLKGATLSMIIAPPHPPHKLPHTMAVWGWGNNPGLRTPGFTSGSDIYKLCDLSKSFLGPCLPWSKARSPNPQSRDKAG